MGREQEMKQEKGKDKEQEQEKGKKHGDTTFHSTYITPANIMQI